MKMGRRRGGGGGTPSKVFDSVLRGRVESCKHKFATVDEIVDNLRANFPDYGRKKLHPFTITVQQILERIKSKDGRDLSRPSTSNAPMGDDGGGFDNDRPVRKKMKTIDSSEQRLQQLESQYVQRRQKDLDQNQGSDSTSPSSLAPSSSSSSSSSEEEDGAVSTSEDAVYEQKFEPEFDLMKSMLRVSYSGSKDAGKSKKKVAAEEKNVELEEAMSSKVARKVDLLGGSDLGKREAKSSSGVGPEEEKGKDGPMFRDLGGMAGVVEELKMEVIVPLYHPQLPKWLGVRPMAGILLHGPPGCGKTKLAHAIANETGVPFYKISATELVSGISGTD